MFKCSSKEAEGRIPFWKNLGISGVGYRALKNWKVNPARPEPYGSSATGLLTRDIPETANLCLPCNQTQVHMLIKNCEGLILLFA